ncbi:hypothetical protein [Herbaspirillum lusitanum]|uniref:hypothetical protein n=1 Tax=Herbaspirillum lusitanum TaxID=213312 RepID=UPI0003175649|nr:hypothetical protein [Herbaspirillum lusitanum]
MPPLYEKAGACVGVGRATCLAVGEILSSGNALYQNHFPDPKGCGKDKVAIGAFKSKPTAKPTDEVNYLYPMRIFYRAMIAGAGT